MLIDYPGNRPRLLESNLLVFLVLTILCFVSFMPTLRALYTPEFVAHYGPLLTKQRSIDLSWVGEEAIKFRKFRPLSSLTHMGLIGLLGTQPIPYKSVHLLLHVCCGFLLFLVVAGWSRRLTAFLTAALFLLLPTELQYKSMTHVMSLERILSLSLLLASYLLWRARDRSLISWNLAGSAALYGLALLSKESVMLMPFVFPLLYMYVEKEGSFRLRRAYLRLLWFGLLLVTYWIVRTQMLPSLHYGVAWNQLRFDFGLFLRNSSKAGTYLLGTRPRLVPPSFPLLAWSAILCSQLIHRSWGTRAAGILWIALAVGPHIHLLFFGANYVYAAMPWLCFTAVLLLDRAFSLLRMRPAVSAMTWVLLLPIMVFYCHRGSTREAGPFVCLYEVASRVDQKKHCPGGFLIVEMHCDQNVADTGKKHEKLLGFLLPMPREQIRISWSTTSKSIAPSDMQGQTMGISWSARIRCPEKGARMRGG